MLTKSSTELVRQQNRALILSALRRHGPMSHTDLAEATALSSATVSAITTELEHDHILQRSEVKPGSGRGRPRILFRQRRDSGYLALIRISSDAVQFSLVDYAGTLMDRIEENRPLGEGGTAALIALIRRVLMRLVERSKLQIDQILAVSITSKGLVAPGEALLLWSPVFGAERIDFEAALSPPFQARITLNNESLLVAAAVHRRLNQTRPTPSVVVVSLGHSIGLGVVQTDLSGAEHMHAPNFGHMLHEPGGALCRCGSRGCIEAYAGFYAILRAAFEVRPDTIPAKFVPIGEIEKIAQRARRGERMPGFAFRQAGYAIGNGLSRLISLYERMPVVVTGPGVRFHDLMRAGIDEGLAQALGIRLEGPPEISVVFDEETLVYEGNLHKTLSSIDLEVFSVRTAATASSSASASAQVPPAAMSSTDTTMKEGEPS